MARWPLAILPDGDAYRVLGATAAVRGDAAAFELRVTSDGSASSASSALYQEAILAARVRATLLVDGQVVAEADSATERFRIQGSTAPS